MGAPWCVDHISTGRHLKPPSPPRTQQVAGGNVSTRQGRTDHEYSTEIESHLYDDNGRRGGARVTSPSLEGGGLALNLIVI